MSRGISRVQIEKWYFEQKERANDPTLSESERANARYKAWEYKQWIYERYGMGAASALDQW